jgi:hypothetical protein
MFRILHSYNDGRDKRALAQEEHLSPNVVVFGLGAGAGSGMVRELKAFETACVVGSRRACQIVLGLDA